MNNKTRLAAAASKPANRKMSKKRTPPRLATAFFGRVLTSFSILAPGKRVRFLVFDTTQGTVVAYVFASIRQKKHENQKLPYLERDGIEPSLLSLTLSVTFPYSWRSSLSSAVGVNKRLSRILRQEMVRHITRNLQALALNSSPLSSQSDFGTAMACNSLPRRTSRMPSL